MILHTLDFQSQRDILTRGDIEASTTVLKQLGDRYMVIFNGGPDAGSSIAHKHLQVFLRPDWRTVADDIAADGPKRKSTIMTHIQALTQTDSLPFHYRLETLAEDATSQCIYDCYLKCCNELAITSGRAHSLLLVKEWLMIIPRACATIQGPIAGAPIQGGANAMIGMLWLKSAEQFENW